MKIGIIGAGFIGRGLASLAGKSGHEVMISNSRAPRNLGSTAVALRCQMIMYGPKAAAPTEIEQTSPG